MRADAQRDGRPTEYRWRPLRKFCTVIIFLVQCRKVWLTPVAGVPCNNADNLGERKTWTQSEICTLQIPLEGQQPPKMN